MAKPASTFHQMIRGLGLRRLLFCLFLLITTVASAFAAPPDCTGDSPGGVAPLIVTEALAPKTMELCFTEFAVLNSGLSRTPLWAAEHLTATQLKSARDVERENDFHAETALPVAWRAELSDYAHSGYDRGHMAPSADMATRQAQQESFSLANMVPQAPRLNRVLWAHIEEAVRALAEQDGELYVVTGPLFEGSELKSLKGHVLVPTGTFKAIYDPRTGTSGAYVADNDDSGRWVAMSIAQLTELSGIDVFPGLPDSIKTAAPVLPKPR